jgi:branched-chain amino acid transport system permease protein
MLASSIVSGIVVGAIYALVAAGLALVFGVVKIINFAQGALLTVALYGVYLLTSGLGMEAYLTLPLVVIAMGAVGWLIQAVLIDRVLRKERISQLLVTFGLGMALKNGCLAIFGGDYRSVNVSFGASVVTAGGVRVPVVDLIAVGGAALSVGLLVLFLRATRVGTAIRVVAQQPDSAELAGINVRRMYALAFAIGSALVGAAAVLISPMYAIQPDTGDTFGIIAFIVVILGGLGSVVGAAAAGLLIGIGQSVFATMVNVQMSVAFVFGAFIVLMIWRPNGLFGRTERVA